MKTFKLTVSTPQGNLFEREITMLSLYGTEGSLAVMANHIPFITTTKAGQVKISTEDSELLAEATGGILTVTHEGTTLLCTEFNIK